MQALNMSSANEVPNHVAVTGNKCGLSIAQSATAMQQDIILFKKKSQIRHRGQIQLADTENTR